MSGRILYGRVLRIRNCGTVATVLVKTRKKHKKYGKIYCDSKKFHVKIPNGVIIKADDMVSCESCRPLSKTISWLVKVGEK